MVSVNLIIFKNFQSTTNYNVNILQFFLIKQKKGFVFVANCFSDKDNQSIQNFGLKQYSLQGYFTKLLLCSIIYLPSGAFVCSENDQPSILAVIMFSVLSMATFIDNFDEINYPNKTQIFI